MTDQQLMTLAFSVIIPISVMIYSNSRITEVSKRIDDISKKIDDLKGHIDSKIDNAFDHMKLLLELHEAKHHKD